MKFTLLWGEISYQSSSFSVVLCCSFVYGHMHEGPVFHHCENWEGKWKATTSFSMCLHFSSMSCEKKICDCQQKICGKCCAQCSRTSKHTACLWNACSNLKSPEWSCDGHFGVEVGILLKVNGHWPHNVFRRKKEKELQSLFSDGMQNLQWYVSL